MAGLKFPIKEGHPAPDSGLTSAISPLPTGGPFKRSLERLFLQGLNFGFLTKFIPGDTGLLLQEVFDISLDAPRVVLRSDGKVDDAFDSAGKRVHAYNTAGAVQHPGDAGTDRVLQAIFRPLRLLRTAEEQAASPTTNSCDINKQIIPTSAIAMGKFVDGLPAWVGVIVEKFGMEVTSKTRELRGLAAGLAGLLEAVDIVLGTWPELKKRGYKEYRQLKNAGDLIERNLSTGNVKASKEFLQKILTRLSEDIPAVTSAYRALRKTSTLSTWERIAVRTSAALQFASAFETVPGDFWPMRAAGSALISIGLLRRPNVRFFRPLAELRGAVGVAQALYPLIEKRIHDKDTKNLVAGFLDERLRVYTMDKDYKGSALQKYLTANYGENFDWKDIPEHLRPRLRVPDQFIHDGLISPFASLGATVCQFPGAWDKMVSILRNVDRIPGVPQHLKDAFVDTFMVGLQAAGGQRNPFQHDISPGYDATDVARLQLNPNGTVDSVDGSKNLLGARSAPQRMYTIWALAKWGYYRYMKGLDPTQIPVLPPSHQRPTDEQIEKMDVLDRAMSDRHFPTLLDDSLRNINDYARWYQLGMGIVGNRVGGEVGKFFRALAEFPRNLNISLALT